MPLSLSYFFNLSEFPYKELFDSCKYPWTALTKIETFLKNRTLGDIQGHVSSFAYLINPEYISIGLGSIIEPGAYIQGPCIIGKNSTVRHGAYMRGNVIVGDGCVIGHDTEVKNSIFLQGAMAGHFAYIGDSILGNKVNLGAGTKCANLKLDHSEVFVHYEGEKISTSLRKFGAILGDETQMGCNSVTNPGTLMGPRVHCYPCLNVGGFIPSRSLLKPETGYTITSY